MNLRSQAAIDMKSILEDVDGGFAQLIRVTSPELETITLSGIYREIDHAIDPQTGELVSSRTASVVLSSVSLAAAGMSAIRNVPDESMRPWVIELTDASGTLRTYKVSDTPTDELGAVTCLLEAYKPI